MSNSMATVFYGDNAMRTTTIKKELWWSVVDVCKVIGVKNSRNVYRKLDEDEKDTVQFLDCVGRKKEIQMCNEPGLYHILLTSHSEKAKAFRRWVTHEVLPRIRKYGYYKLTIAEQKDKCLNSIMDTLGVTELENKYYKMTLPQLERESKILKYEKSSKEEFQKAKEQYPYTYGDMIGFLNYYRWLKEIMIMHDIEKQKKYCYKLSDGTLLFSELFKERAKRYVSDPYYEWEE